MSRKKQTPMLQLLIGRFKRAAIVTHFGYEDEDAAIQRAGIASAKRAIEEIDAFGSGARLALVPLLDDPDPSIRVFAAGHLVKVTPERALAVLKEINERCPTLAQMTASDMLWRHRHGELKM